MKKPPLSYFPFVLQHSLLDSPRKFSVPFSLRKYFLPISAEDQTLLTKLVWLFSFIKLYSPDPNLNSCTDRHVGKLQLIYSLSNNHPLQLSLLLLATSFPDDIIGILFLANKSKKSMLFEYPVD